MKQRGYINRLGEWNEGVGMDEEKVVGVGNGGWKRMGWKEDGKRIERGLKEGWREGLKEGLKEG